MMRTIVLVAFACAAPVWAEVVTKEIEYEHEGVKLVGLLAYDDAVDGQRPGVLIVHEWWGRTAFADKEARELAKHGYVAFALDMYGGGKTTSSSSKAAEWAGQFQNQPKLRAARARAGLQILAKHERVDESRIGAIGFCFGGTTVIEMAYAGHPLKGVVSFHGNLPTIEQDQAKQVRAEILICHGEADPFVKSESVQKFTDALAKTEIAWTLAVFSQAEHSFTNPGADKHEMKGVSYHARADELAHSFMYGFFGRLFGEDRHHGG